MFLNGDFFFRAKFAFFIGFDLICFKFCLDKTFVFVCFVFNCFVFVCFDTFVFVCFGCFFYFLSVDKSLGTKLLSFTKDKSSLLGSGLDCRSFTFPPFIATFLIKEAPSLIKLAPNSDSFLWVMCLTSGVALYRYLYPRFMIIRDIIYEGQYELAHLMG